MRTIIRKTTLLVLLVMAGAMGCKAQSTAEANDIETRIKQIRQAYANRLQLMQNQPYDDMKINQMELNYYRMYGGIGLYHESDTYYWTDDENENYYIKPTLYFVTKRYSRNSGLYKHTYEYLFDAETEEPMFLYVTTQKGDAKPSEFRFYFDKGRIIRQLPERIDPIDDETHLAPDFPVDAEHHVPADALLKDFNDLKTFFHQKVETKTW